MRPSDKMQLLKSYRNKTRAVVNSESVLDEIKPVVESKTPVLRNDANVTGKELHFDSAPLRFEATVQEPILDDDFGFKPLSFGANVTASEEQSKDIYEELKQAIMSIDCTRGLEHAYKELDDMLTKMSDDASEELTNSQLLVLVSTMIIKLEELNSYNYPELDLTEVKNKLDSDGKRAATFVNFEEYFFTSFFTHYQTIELQQFTELKSRYNSDIEGFSNFQQKKSEMLMTLLKWLIN